MGHFKVCTRHPSGEKVGVNLDNVVTAEYREDEGGQQYTTLHMVNDRMILEVQETLEQLGFEEIQTPQPAKVRELTV